MDIVDKIRDLLSWADLLQILALIYAGYEFLNGDKIKKFLFYKEGMSIRTFFIIIAIFVLNIVSDLMFLIRSQETLHFKFILPEIVLNGLVFKISAIALLAFLIIWYFFLTLFPGYLKSRLKYNKRKPKEFVMTVLRLLKFQSSVDKENYKLVADFLLRNDNLRKVIKSLETDLEGEEFTNASLLLDHTLIDKGFIEYLITEDRRSLLKILGIIKEERSTKCYSFVKILSSKLINDDSLLDVELDGPFGDGSFQFIVANLYTDDFFYNHYSLFDVDFDCKNVNYNALRKLIRVLELSIEDYLSKSNNQVYNRIWGNPFRFALENISLLYMQTIYLLNVENAKYGWSNKILDSILIFFGRMQHYYKGSSKKFSRRERLLLKSSFTNELVRHIFDIISYTGILSTADGIDYAKDVLLSFSWLWRNDKKIDSEVFERIKAKILDLFEARIAENIDGKHPSLIRLILSVFGTGGVTKFIIEKYKASLIKQIRTVSSVEVDKLLPIGWRIGKEGHIYIDNKLLINVS